MTVQLTGQPFHYDLDKREPMLDYSVHNELGADYCVHMVHGMVVDRPLPPGVPCTMADSLWSKDVDVLLTGHYHAGFPVKHRKGRYIVNPGALSRINNHPSEMKRHPQVAILDFDKEISVRLIRIQCAAPGDSVLDRSYLEKAAYREEKMNAFVQVLRDDREFRALNIREVVEEIAGLEKVEDEVKHEALRRIALVQEEMGWKGGENE